MRQNINICKTAYHFTFFLDPAGKAPAEYTGKRKKVYDLTLFLN